MTKRTKKLPGKGQGSGSRKGQMDDANAGQANTSGKGQELDADSGQVCRASPTGSSLPSEGRRIRSDTGHLVRADARQSLISQIRSFHRQRCFAMEQRKRANLALGAYLRTQLGWRLDLDEKERKRIATLAANLVKCGEKIADGKEHELSGSDEYSEFAFVIDAAIKSRGPFDHIEAVCEKNLKKLAEQLDVWRGFGADVRGFGAASLGVIVAEAGDLANYSSKSKLWKRMGVAVIGDIRQGGLKKGAGAEQWIAHGYNRQRRSRLWNIGDTIIKAQVRKVGDTEARTSLGEYGACYLSRKQYELARDPEMKPIAAHRRAQRYMEKRLLKNLWQAWRATVALSSDGPNIGSPPN